MKEIPFTPPINSSSQSMVYDCVFDASNFRSSKLSKAETSRLASLRNSNAYPHSQERDELFAMLQSTRQHSNAIAQRIAGLQAQLVDLTKEKEKVDALISDLSIVLHPIRTIPQEILSEIFTALALISPPPTTLRHSNKLVDSLNKSAPGWVLSKVSSGWRRAALSTRPLWTTVVLQLRDKPLAHHSDLSSFFLLSTFLARSRNKKLSVHICSDWEVVDLIPNRCITALLLTCRRWQHVSFTLCYKAFDVLKACPGPFSSLVSLSLDVYDRVPSNDMNRYGHLFNHDNAPHLRTLSLTEPALLPCFGIPPNLRHYRHIKAFSWESNEYQWHSENLQILRLLPRLKSAIFVAQPPPQATGNLVTYLLPTLHNLSVSGTAGGIRDLCRRINAPALTRLHVGCILSLDTVFPSGKSPLLSTSHSVTELNLSIKSGGKSEVVALESALNQMPSVAYLTLRFGSVHDTSKVIKALNASTASVIAPVLKVLVLEASYGWGVSVDHCLVEMIVSRRCNLKEGVRMLERVSIDYTGENKTVMSFNELPLDDLQGRTYTKLLIQ